MVSDRVRWRDHTDIVATKWGWGSEAELCKPNQHMEDMGSLVLETCFSKFAWACSLVVELLDAVCEVTD